MLTELAQSRRVVLLDIDPDLAEGLDDDEIQAARARTVASVLDLEPPTWDPMPISRQAESGWLGLLVVEGVLIRRTHLGRRSACELFGPSDLIRPWDTEVEYGGLPLSSDWVVLRNTRVAILDTEFALRTSRWPTINSRIVGRLVQRARNLSLT
ncbi:MAG: hypothetical protein ACYC0H_06975, partial [Solirubrobacteraceae bacterium]